MISALSRRGILFGTVDSTGLQAVYAATNRDAQRAEFYGPAGPGHLGGRPGQQKLYSRLRSAEDARRIWDASAQLTTKATFPSA